ncbi:Mobile element protein, partial [hydrothermal vent metagenome]
MKSSKNTLPNDPEKLKVLLHEKELEIKKLQEQNQHLLEQFRLAQQARFGKKSEVHAGQGELFNEVEQLIDEAVIEEQDAPQHKTKKKQPKRQALPKDLPREIVVVDLSEEEKTCDCCG